MFAASHLGLFCLPMSHKKDARLIWVKIMVFSYRKKYDVSFTAHQYYFAHFEPSQLLGEGGKKCEFPEESLENLEFRKVPKFSDTRKLRCNLSKTQTLRSQTLGYFVKKMPME